MKFLAAVLSSSILVACGSGGGGSDAPASLTTESPSTPSQTTESPSTPPPATGSSPPVASPAIEALAKYAGVWRKDCDNHMRVTKTATAKFGTTFSVVTREDYYDNADCTGALVATGSYGLTHENVTYAATLANASVTLPTGENIQADVDPATSVAAVATFSMTGRGVISSYYLDEMKMTYTVIQYADKSLDEFKHTALNGQTTYGAFLLRNDELLALVPIDGFTKSFTVRHRYVR